MNKEPNLAVFCDFENLAIGARDARLADFDINLALARLLDKGRILVKRAYSDWKRYAQYRKPMHEAGFELIEIPHVSYSGKNSADIYLVVDALDMCYTRKHIDTFVIMSGDSDFSPLVRKLRENDKRVVGLGVKNASSDMLIENCDEFIFYDDLVRIQRRLTQEAGGQAPPPSKAAAPAEGPPEAAAPPAPRRQKSTPRVEPVPVNETGDEGSGAPTTAEKTGDAEDAIQLVLETVEALFREREDDIWGSQVKQTIKRKRPHFDESYYGFRSFSQLLEVAAERGLLDIRRDERGGGYVIYGFGPEA
ncbi:MAG: NYN domain-containing protein [Myxococcales bacterium]|nr:NYN domain-containing protein [Myxococcales bacterium]MCB9532087.1 NYN domain-containing protein [Myxococcales bacterium]MCB9533288.1 NYN domain-containing protein [Myxococcales bacterium]